MYQSIGLQFQVRYIKEVWNADNGHLIQEATLDVWNLKTDTAFERHMTFCGFDAKSIYRKLNHLDSSKQREVFINQVWNNAGY